MARHRDSSVGWLMRFTLALLLQTGCGEVVEIMYPTQEDIVSATTALKMRCRFVGLQGSEYTAAVDINEEDGGEYPIAADGEYTFTLSPLTQGEHRLAVILLHGPHYMVRTRHQVTFQSSSNPQPQQIPPPSPPPPPPAPPAPVPEQVPTMSITGPSQCQKMPQDDVTTILTTSEFGSSLQNATLTLEINGYHQPMAFGKQSVGIAQMPKGLHLLVLRADWTSAGGESKSLRSAPLWFGLDVDFSVEAVEHTAQRHLETGGDVLAQAQLWRCMVQHTHQLFPKLWIALSAARAYQEALGYMCKHTHTHTHTHTHVHTYKHT